MTKSTITRERIQRIMRAINSEAYDEEEIREWLSSDEIMELSRMALAAMDSEPVAIVEPSDYVTAAQLVGERPVRKAVHELYEGALRIGDKLYRHAQPASVVPDELNTRTANDVMNEHLSWKDYGDAEVFCIAWNACRAAMLNGGNDE
jgi:hypothetical protein